MNPDIQAIFDKVEERIRTQVTHPKNPAAAQAYMHFNLAVLAVIKSEAQNTDTLDKLFELVINYDTNNLEIKITYNPTVNMTYLKYLSVGGRLYIARTVGHMCLVVAETIP
jgi:hypothetical protein